jgi:hypothetical protein
MLSLSKNVEENKKIDIHTTDLDVFKEPHFSTLISRLFDVYKRYPNQKT